VPLLQVQAESVHLFRGGSLRMSTPLSVRGLRDQLVDRLRFEVLSGRFKEGEVIRQHELGALFGVSRTPVREALIQLKNEGLVESAGNGGVRVTSQAPEAHRDFLNPLRRAVEIYALQLCFESLGQDDFAQLDELVERMKAPCATRDFVSLAELDVAFHRTIVEKSGQPTLLAIWSLVVGGIRTSFRESYDAFGDIMDICREHGEIVNRLRSGDKDAAIDFYASKIGQLPPARRAQAGESPDGAAVPADGAPTGGARTDETPTDRAQADGEAMVELARPEFLDASAILMEFMR
jgi:DNA-binding GntR family transcriptional regulator